VKRITAAETVEYVLDERHVLEEAAGAGQPSHRRYHYAEEPLLVMDRAVASFISTDALGSPTDFTNSTGTLSAKRQYDAWGQYRNGTAPGGLEPKVGYTGHQFDPETGLVYARARYYDPELGRFISRDTFEGDLADAPSLHRYAYAANNPLANVDPTGNWWSRRDWENSGNVLAGYAVGVAKVFGAVGFLTYYTTGAALYALTDDPTYKGQADTFNQSLHALGEAAESPGKFGKALWEGFIGGLERSAEAIERGDAYGAGEGLGDFVAQAVLLVDAAQRVNVKVNVPSGPAPAVATVGVRTAAQSTGRAVAITGLPQAAGRAGIVMAHAINEAGRKRDVQVAAESRSGPGTEARPAEARASTPGGAAAGSRRPSAPAAERPAVGSAGGAPIAEPSTGAQASAPSPPATAAGGTEALATRASEVHGALHPVAQRMRATAVLETSGGRVVAGGGPDLTPAQRALLGPGESAARLPGAHAEVTALTHAQQAGVTPQAMAVTRTICPQCAAAIEASGGTVTSPTTAVWPR
jgi:RHS repeat-associated protein